MRKIFVRLLFLCIASVGASAHAVTVNVSIMGTVGFNQINTGPLANAVAGDDVILAFQLDSDVFTDSTNFPVRGYELVAGSFSFTAGGNSIGLADPLPANTVPYFILRNDDPAVDGFFLGTNVDGFPNGVPSDSDGGFGPFSPNVSVTYNNDPLSSLDILGALGTYDFTGLTNFGFTVDDGPFSAMEVNFEQMTISQVPVPAAVWFMLTGVLSLAGLGRIRK